MAEKSFSYRDAGVDIKAGNRLVDIIKPLAKSTHAGTGVLGGLGGFGALYALPGGYQEPILVSGTDGVGTKLKLADKWHRHDGVGIDLVAMCVNDILVLGAKPMFFLDYFATGRLDVERAASVIEGIAEGCRQAGAALIGGETAEMPGMYQNDDYDLAGFCVGIVEKNAIIDGSKVAAGDVLIGVASSGPHSNGYSLIRKIVDHSGATADDRLDDRTLADWLLTPTRIYVKPVLELLTEVDIHALAHITGGGLLENIPRVLPPGCQARIKRSNWPEPAIFRWLQEQGHIEDSEMVQTFNCGIGLVLCVSPQQETLTKQHFEKLQIPAWTIGHVVEGDRGVQIDS